MYRLPNPRHVLAGGPQVAGPQPTCPKGQVLKCKPSPAYPGDTSVECECKAVKTGPIVAGEPEPFGFTAPSTTAQDTLTCPAGYELRCVGSPALGWTCNCQKGTHGNYTFAQPIISAPPRTRGLKANPQHPQRLTSKQGQFACPHGYVRWCYTQGGEVKCMCRKCMVTPEGIPDCLYAPPLPSGGTNTRGLTANPHRRPRPRYHRVANFFR